MPFYGFADVRAHLLIRRDNGHALMVDCGPPGRGKKLGDAIASDLEGNDLKGILLTHAHLDHVGDVAELKKRFDAPLIAHSEDAKALRTGVLDIPRYVFRSRLLGVGLAVIHPFCPVVQIDVAHSGEHEIEGFGRLLPTPGHHRNQVALILDSGDAMVGDSVAVAGGRLSVNLFYDQWEDSIRSIDVLAKNVTGTMYTGHWDPRPASELKNVRH